MQQSFEEIKRIKEELAALDKLYPTLFRETFGSFDRPAGTPYRPAIIRHITSLSRDLRNLRSKTRELDFQPSPLTKYHDECRTKIWYIIRYRINSWRLFSYKLEGCYILWGGESQSIKRFIEYNENYKDRKYILWSISDETEPLEMEGELSTCRVLNRKAQFEDAWIARGPHCWVVTPTKLGCKRRYSNKVFNQIRQKLG